MKPTPYLKQVLKELDGRLKILPRKERTRALDAYKIGLEVSFHECYPNRTPDLNVKELTPSVSCMLHGTIFRKGYYVAKQFGELEVDYARQLLLDEVGKRQAKYSKPGLLGRLFGRKK
jgi:hypothetical protein